MKKVFVAGVLASTCFFTDAAVISVQSDFSDVTDWQLNGSSAVGSNNRLALTNGLGQSGSAFLKNTVSLNNDVSFSSFFTFEITNPVGQTDTFDGLQGADGLAFVLQTNSNTTGGQGGSIGYGGLTNSVAIEFDTWANGAADRINGTSNGNHVGISLNGNVASVALAPEANAFNTGGIWSVWVDYNGVTDLLDVRWSNNGQRSANAGLSTTVDLTNVLSSTNAFFGFTSGTAAAGGLHEILAYEFRDDFEPVVEASAPVSLSLMSLGLAGLFARKKKQNKTK